jgi:hypothetical protein
MMLMRDDHKNDDSSPIAQIAYLSVITLLLFLYCTLRLLLMIIIKIVAAAADGDVIVIALTPLPRCILACATLE